MVTNSFNHDIILLQKGGDTMRKSYLNLIGRPLDDVNREFQVLLLKLKGGYVIKDYGDENLQKQVVERWNTDLDGWINWLESLKKK